MSHYSKIVTAYKTPESLIKALDDMKLPYRKAANLRENSLTLKTHWTSFGGVDQPCAIALDREAMNNAGYHVMDGMGFRWNGSGYELIQDHYDEVKPRMVETLAHLKQRYGFHETNRLLRRQGYTVRATETEQDGTIRVVLARR